MTKLSVSNIAWSSDEDEYMYDYLAKNGYCGIEIAPTRLYPINPYIHLVEANQFRKRIYKYHSLRISSIQSIWYGREENFFENEYSKNILVDYTKQAIDFANALYCKNIVFGCPRNRFRNNRSINNALSFFSEVARYAELKETIISIEANPKIYNTDFINYTQEAFEFIKIIDLPGLRVNLDVGTIIENSEDLSLIENNFNLVNHIHISEPFLKPLKERKIHRDIKRIISRCNYNGYVSLEMGKYDDRLFDTLAYFEETFS